jgi:hypothetical protein
MPADVNALISRPPSLVIAQAQAATATNSTVNNKQLASKALIIKNLLAKR